MVNEFPSVSLMRRYTTKEACTILGVCRNTLVKYTRAGMIEFGTMKSNGRRFYLGGSLLKFYNSVL